MNAQGSTFAPLLALAALAGCGGGSDGVDGDAGAATGVDAPDPGIADVGSVDPGTDAPGDGAQARVGLRPDQVTTLDGDGGTSVVVQGYDDAGLLRVQETFTDGSVTLVSRFSYDAASQIVERVDVDGAGLALGRVAYAYVMPGAQSAREFFDADERLVARLTYEFDADGLVEAANLERVAFEDGTPIPGGPQLVQRTEYAYAAGRLVMESIDDEADNVPDAVRDYVYAADGTLESTSFTNAASGAGSVATWRYQAGPCTLAWTNSVSAHFCIAADDGG